MVRCIFQIGSNSIKYIGYTYRIGQSDLQNLIFSKRIESALGQTGVGRFGKTTSLSGLKPKLKSTCMQVSQEAVRHEAARQASKYRSNSEKNGELSGLQDTTFWAMKMKLR